MSQNTDTSALVNNIIRVVAGGVFISTGLLAPQMLKLLDKPTQKLFKKLDERDIERKLKESVIYMRRQGLLIGDYEHGLEITKKAKKRLEKYNFDSINIKTLNKWDDRWRLVLFDIPEQHRDMRVAFTRKIRLLGLQPLQQSIWIHPFECRDEITIVCEKYAVTEWVTYIETNHIDHEEKLVKRFSHLIK